MDKLILKSNQKTAKTSLNFKRYLFNQIDWSERLSIILGHRGVGKTTLMLQAIQQFGSETSIYLSLDAIYFEENRLSELVDQLYAKGYRRFFLDEVHRYPHWSKDLKNIYDDYDDAYIVATGSSILEISKGQADLSRRAVEYKLVGLSFREYLSLSESIEFDTYSLEEIIQSHHIISSQITDKTSIIKHFNNYLKQGYYPFFKDGNSMYSQKLEATTNLILDIDIISVEELNYSSIRNMKKLLYVISQSVPFKPNVSKLSEKLDIPRNTILKMLDLLDRAQLLSLLRSDTQGVSYLQKPEKIYLQNTNLAWTLSQEKPNSGNLRETFFFNQLQVKHEVTASRFSDFMVDNTYTFEIGGSTKTTKQLSGVPNSYIAADDITAGNDRKIPLWLFGFTY